MFDALFGFIDTIIVANITSMVGTFTAIITPLLGACVTLYIIYLSYQSLFDSQNMVVMESIKTIGALAVVTTVALNTPWYLGNVVPVVLTIGDDISMKLLNSPVGGSGIIQRIFDIMINRSAALWGTVDIDIWAPASLGHAILVLIMYIVCLFGFIPFLAISAAYLLVAKIMVSFLLIIGPLFIMMAFFPSTRSFFQAWTGQCFNYMLLSILYPLAFTVFIQILETVVFTSALSLSNTFMTAIIFFVLIVLSSHIPTLSSTLSGGIGINGLTD